MAAPLDVTQYNPMLREYWLGSKVDLVFRRNLLLSTLPKDEKAGGRNWRRPIKYAYGAGASAVLTDAQTKDPPKFDAFVGDYVRGFSSEPVNNDVIERSQNDKVAVASALKEALDDVAKRLANKLEYLMFGDGWGSIGQIASISTNTITLTRASDAKYFGLNQLVVLSSSLNAAALRNSGATIKVSGINTTTGVITFTTGVVATIAAAANSDYIFPKGDREDAASPTRRCPYGLAAWLPTSVPSSTAFNGVDRSVHPSLYGVIYNGSGKSFSDTMYELAMAVADNNGAGDAPKIAVCSNKQYGQAMKALHGIGKVEFTEVKGSGIEIGFSGIKIMTPAGEVKLVSAHKCPDGLVYMLDPDTWSIESCGELIHSPLRNGEFIDAATADEIEMRRKFLLDLTCENPGANGVAHTVSW